jgi:alpha-glucosidase (family GH31 glycosyl hydrolase)
MQSVATSLPVMRPLVLDWQDDPTTATIDDQWMFGEWLLVAPILDERNRRQIYLPAGRWFDFWSGAAIDGPRWITRYAALDELPLYVRAGAILPLAPDMAYTGEKAWDPLTVLIYPGDQPESQFSMIDDQEHLHIWFRQTGAKIIVGVDGAQKRRTVEFEVYMDNQVHRTSIELSNEKRKDIF